MNSIELNHIIKNLVVRWPLLRAQHRQINIDKLSNKKITRLESDIELGDCEFKSRIINRNPRSLENLSFEYKPKGFWLEKSPPAYWNKMVFEQSGRYLTASLQHWSGKRLIEASTKEPQLAKYYNGPSTIQAATILAQVISRRCLQSGYLCAGIDEIGDDQTSLKSKVFFEAVESNGIILKESPEIEPRCVTDL